MPKFVTNKVVDITDLPAELADKIYVYGRGVWNMDTFHHWDIITDCSEDDYYRAEMMNTISRGLLEWSEGELSEGESIYILYWW